MLRLTLSLSLILGLSACSGANLKDSSKLGQRAGNGSNMTSDGPKQTGSGSENSQEAPATAPNGTATINDGSLNGEGGSLDPVLGATPVVQPTVIAGASLSCSLTSANKELRCETKKDGALIDVKPQATYAAAGNGQAVVWQALDMKMASVGVYTSAAPSITGQYIVSMRLSASSYLTDLVGEGNLQFYNHIKDPSFESFVFSSAEKDFFSSELANSKWSIAANATSGCGAGDSPLLRIQQVSPGGSHIAAIDGTKWAALDSRCGSEIQGPSEGNYSLRQVMPALTIGNFYHVSFLAGADDANTASPPDAQVTVHWGLAADTKSITLTPSSAWKRYSMNVWAKSSSVTLNFEEKGVPNHKGTMIDSVLVLDLGVPPAMP